ncbi:MAG: guanylate kinase [marine bacterium B5-7]|nr:MAG: guanylate kinase [marine bacterium B5-7]
MPNGSLYIIAAPSGGGKTSLVHALLNANANLCLSISYTTRPPRIHEKNNIDYHFVDQAQFDDLCAKKQFLEHATVFGHGYATSKTWVLKQLQAGHDVILEIDWQGAEQIKQGFPEAVGIFILPPSLPELEARLRARATDSDEVIAGRLAQAQADMRHYPAFDYLVVNDDFDTALQDLQAILRAERRKQKKQANFHAQLLADLLA